LKQEFQILLLHDRPEENDLELLAALSNCGLDNDFLIFVLNTGERVNNFLHFKKSGADYYLVHPYNLHHLTEIISHHYTGLKTENLTIHAGTQIKKDLKILLSANNTLIRKNAQTNFKKLGFEIDCASDGEDAIKKISGNHYDIVFIDLIFPDKDCHEIINEIRDIGYTSPIIVLAAADSEEMIRIKEIKGTNGHITRPVKLSEIRRILIQNFPSKR
jgi:DNA-binding response OmpR family regulator